MMPEGPSASLYLVPTPIGNLGDITLRALEVLKEVDLIVAEDTRKTGFLLKHYGISKPLKSFHAHNEHRVIDELVERMQNGQKLALVSDAGTPGISDPGFLAIRACHTNELRLEVLPGAVAMIPALINSGLPADRFAFEGFLPQKKGRKSRIESLKMENRTMIFYESPYRVVKLIEELGQLMGLDRPACLVRELTKLHEETIRGSLGDLLLATNNRSIKGECILVVSGLK